MMGARTDGEGRDGRTGSEAALWGFVRGWTGGRGGAPSLSGAEALRGFDDPRGRRIGFGRSHGPEHPGDRTPPVGVQRGRRTGSRVPAALAHLSDVHRWRQLGAGRDRGEVEDGGSPDLRGLAPVPGRNPGRHRRDPARRPSRAALLGRGRCLQCVLRGDLPGNFGTFWDGFAVYGPDARWGDEPGPLATSGVTVIGESAVLGDAIRSFLGPPEST